MYIVQFTDSITPNFFHTASNKTCKVTSPLIINLCSHEYQLNKAALCMLAATSEVQFNDSFSCFCRTADMFKHYKIKGKQFRQIITAPCLLDLHAMLHLNCEADWRTTTNISHRLEESTSDDCYVKVQHWLCPPAQSNLELEPIQILDLISVRS